MPGGIWNGGGGGGGGGAGIEPAEMLATAFATMPGVWGGGLWGAALRHERLKLSASHLVAKALSS